MDKRYPKMKECVVLLEPCTPKKQLALSAELRKVIDERNILTTRTKRKIFTALDELDVSDFESKRLSKKNKAVQEILDTEAAYLKQLENIMTFFMTPIKERKILNNTEFDVLFGSINSLYKVNGELLNELKEDLLYVANAFSKLAPFFKLYSVYAYDFKYALQMLNKLHQTNPEFAKLLVNQESRPEVQAKLSSLLITPIQRVPRYCLLLKQVLDNTLTTDDDYITLKGSLKKLEEVARHVNSLVEDGENSQRLLELNRCLKNGKNLMITPGRKLIKEGVVNKHSNKKKSKVYLVLMSDILICCEIKKNNIELPNSLKWSHIYPLNKCRISMNSLTKMFEVNCQDDRLVLYHDKGSETDDWVKIIDETIEKCITNRKTLRKGSSSRRPAGRNNFKDYVDVGVSPGISRIRKRRRTHEEDGEKVVEPVKILKLDSTDESTIKCLPKCLAKRKNIKRKMKNEIITDSEDEITRKKDSLFPLREHFINSEATTKTNENHSVELLKYHKDVFVFGRPNQERQNFTFRFVNMITGIGNSIKRVLGFN